MHGATEYGILGACALYFIKEFFNYLKSRENKKNGNVNNVDRRELDKLHKTQMIEQHQKIIQLADKSIEKLNKIEGTTDSINGKCERNEARLIAVKTKLGLGDSD